MLHALLEEKALREAADHLGKDVSDPEVQQLGRATYQAVSLQLSDSNSVDEMYASDAMQTHRTTAQEGISAATRSHLTGLAAISAAGEYQVLVPSALSNNTLSSLLSSLPPLIQLPQGYPGLHTDRYVREFVELDLVGKGGYGKVYRVKHKLDNSLYAVKRIMVSPTRLHEHGPQEMEKMLEEVRALARFDHENIVRYHNCWLEFTAGPTDMPAPTPSTKLFRNDRLIEDASAHSFEVSGMGDLNARVNSLPFGDPFSNPDQGAGADIVFENSDAGPGAEESKPNAEIGSLNDQDRTPERRNRRASQASHTTIATVSSPRSKMSAIASADGENEDDKDAALIPRNHQRYSEESTSEYSQSLLSHSDMPDRLISPRTTGPVLTINVQMSLYDTNLADFLSTDQTSVQAGPQPHHCFHPCISLELLAKIISGVEYLHAQGVVHRDLKPANIFLATSQSRIPPTGSIDLSTCQSCPTRDCLHITPRIGDFGLVATLGDKRPNAEAVTKPVGTEFYRPEAVGRVNEKLDVFALGVVAFEMLCRFGTKMERADTLMRLRRGEFPKGFAQEIGEHGEELQGLLAGMVRADEEERSSCEAVKRELGVLVQALRAQTDD